jgi:hypothetical protein
LSYSFLITLDGCRHLDGLEQRWIVHWLLVIVADFDQEIVMGSLLIPGEIVKSNYSEIMASQSAPFEWLLRQP